MSEEQSGLLLAVTEIRHVTGVGGKPMLSELGGAVRAVLDARRARITKLEAALHEIAGCALSGSFFEEIALDALKRDPEDKDR